MLTKTDSRFYAMNRTEIRLDSNILNGNPEPVNF